MTTLGSIRRNENLTNKLRLRSSFSPGAMVSERLVFVKRHEVRIGFTGMTRRAGGGDVVMARIGAEPPPAASVGTGTIKRCDAVANLRLTPLNEASVGRWGEQPRVEEQHRLL